MVERPVLTEPFEQMAFDLVGPLPKAKGGYRFVFTAVCIATCWPEAILLKTITVRAVAEGMVNIFSRTAIPLQILSDQGTQCLSLLVKELCKLLGIQRMKTTAYQMAQWNACTPHWRACLPRLTPKGWTGHSRSRLSSSLFGRFRTGTLFFLPSSWFLGITSEHPSSYCMVSGRGRLVGCWMLVVGWSRCRTGRI